MFDNEISSHGAIQKAEGLTPLCGQDGVGTANPQQNDTIVSATQQILHLLGKSPAPPPGGGLATGSPGLALFYWQAMTQSIGEATSSILDIQIEQTITELAELQLGPGFLTGSPGYLWLLELLQRPDVFDASELTAVIEEHDDALLKLSRDNAFFTDYELLYGLTGVMQYTVCAAISPLRQAIFKAVLGQLICRSRQTASGLLIPTAARSRFKRLGPDAVECDLGLAHGLPGTVATLAAGRTRGLCGAEVDDLIASFAKTLLAARQPHGASLFPYNTGQRTESRLAWCYGDLCVANALYLAGTAIGDCKLIDAAIAIALHACARSRDSFGMDDHAICHGTGGLVLLFSAFHRRTGHIEFERICTELTNALVAAIGAGEALTYRKFGTAVPASSEMPGLLNGLAGIGLVLLSQHSLTGESPLTDALALYH